MLGEGAYFVGEAVRKLADNIDRFAEDYHRMLDRVLAGGLPTALCTIYEANSTQCNHDGGAAYALWS